MTDLSKGIIELENFIVTPETKRDALATAFEDKLAAFSNANLVKFRRTFIIQGQEFSCFFFFDDTQRIKSIELTPCVEYKSDSDDRTGQQEERRQACDKWLFEKLGIPHKESVNVTLYYYPNVEVYSISHFDLREGANAGHIIVKYLR